MALIPELGLGELSIINIHSRSTYGLSLELMTELLAAVMIMMRLGCAFRQSTKYGWTVSHHINNDTLFVFNLRLMFQLKCSLARYTGAISVQKDLVVLLDTDYSMGDLLALATFEFTRLAAAQNATEEMLQTLTPGDRATVITFNDSAQATTLSSSVGHVILCPAYLNRKQDRPCDPLSSIP